jgi:hypothetical protein
MEVETVMGRLEFAYHDNFREGTEGFPIPYVASYSPLLREGIKATGTNIAPHVEAIVLDIEGNKEVAASLRAPSEFQVKRQVDIKKSSDPDSPVLLKCFIEWGFNDERQMWVIWIESGEETYWEDQWQMVGEG